MVNSFFDPEQGHNSKVAESRQLVSELREEVDLLRQDCTQSTCLLLTDVLKSIQTRTRTEQQVIDIVRERLEISQGELVEQRQRSDALEGHQAKNVEELRNLAESVSRVGESMEEPSNHDFLDSTVNLKCDSR